MLAAAGFAVAEYDTDVPQFDEVFYLPVLGFAAGIALLLIRAAADERWAATISAVVYAGFMLATGGFLWLVDFPPPALPLLVLPAVVVDVSVRRGWSAVTGAALYAIALHVSYVPVRNVLGDGVRFDGVDVVLGLAITFAAALPLWLVAGTTATVRRPSGRAATAVAATLLAFALVAPAALAHDPGQGDDAGTVALTVALEGKRARPDRGPPGRALRRDRPTLWSPRDAEARRGAGR